MFSIARRQEILDALKTKGSVNILELALHYGVGKETIRRDLKALALDFNISIVYGGAYLKSHSSPIVEETILKKREANIEAKLAIARVAADLIQPGDVIALNSGSTMECILHYLEEKAPLSIVTANINIAARASVIAGMEVYIPAGKVRGKSGMVLTPISHDYLKNFSVDKCFFGVSAINLDHQITHPSIEEVENNRILLSIAEQVFMVADHSKFDKKSLYKLADIKEMTAIVTDKPLPEEYQAYCKTHDVQIFIP
ncbi:DeoR/GlpR family DNA-binding transcription regulator [Candidatus Epulonipiscium viviparus]|uniref:DeoR/GlpR family DNA-binding transcription regulator n=1 Tax=Candidatus Epulonipiscium viviparus TaxID=420336 RepID=UPI0004966AF4|nr:DeoR/GlpR family DNA-binding transcription regulator [Candidatus Epulopiscium viviparus]